MIKFETVSTPDFLTKFLDLFKAVGVITVENNKMILFPSSFTHGVTEVTMENSDVGKGYGRYCLSQFLYLDPTLR